MKREIKVGEVYKHFKGMKVLIICIAKDSETLKKQVVYKHIDSEEYWVRDYDMFNSLVDKDKYPNILQKYRFEKIESNN